MYPLGLKDNWTIRTLRSGKKFMPTGKEAMYEDCGNLSALTLKPAGEYCRLEPPEIIGTGAE